MTLSTTPPNTTHKPPHIAIIGAGLTGTTLAIALLARNIPFTLYEQSPRATELGAGLGFGPNAARALKLIDHRLWEAFMRVSTPRDVRSSAAAAAAAAATAQGEEEESPWIEFLDGTAEGLEPVFKVAARGGEGHGAVHRVRWLEVLMGMVPEGVVRFGKRLSGVERRGEGVVLRFEDGTSAEADAVVGCDGVKSRVRGFVVEGEGAKCGYSGKYAYRCMIPMEKAIEAIGEDRTGVSSLWVSLPGRAGNRSLGRDADWNRWATGDMS